ncbi:AAA family ATPase [Myroides marinus]|uniref:AAA family ATPase n=1 Tax=Myroides marinus TaxID=703342 RepID=UPI002575B09A|nr:AAA family ATPase [Myroides marinus]MDM1379912.1 AAA family ATPase [Myroides marinus]MDM1387139.1 AAA family ATPase [Myroides marinus]MDM1394352.1 AAA family ATPase [Myroides marinus]
MGKIDTIHIYNFKFFDTQDPISLGGKHLLLYGENGSGKSSIYWSLQRLFDSAFEVDSDIQKYFRGEHEESLINIYADPICTGGDVYYDSFVEVRTTHNNPQLYKISRFDTAINNNMTAKEINQSSDFISYKVLYKFQDFWNDKKMDLAPIFKQGILRYINFPEKELNKQGNRISVVNAYEMYNEIENGPGEIKKNSSEYKSFERFVDHFNLNIEELVDFININAPKIIKKLGYDIDFKLSFTKTSFSLSRFKYNVVPFKLELTITKYFGECMSSN